MSGGCMSKHRIEELIGVPPMPITDLPPKCLCGQDIVYSHNVTFNPAPPIPGGRKEDFILGVYVGQVLTVTSKMTRREIAKILGRN